VWAFTRRDVMVMERIYGIPVTDIDTLEAQTPNNTQPATPLPEQTVTLNQNNTQTNTATLANDNESTAQTDSSSETINLFSLFSLGHREHVSGGRMGFTREEE